MTDTKLVLELTLEDYVLLAADTDRTQDYVFESTRLPEIRGASMKLNHLNREVVPNLLTAAYHLPPDFIIYAGGGSLLALVRRSDAAAIAKEIKDLYLQETGSATITTAVYEPTTAEEFERGVLAREVTPEHITALLGSLAPAERARVRAYFRTGGERADVFSETSFNARKHFGEVVKWVGLELRARKEQKVWVPFYEVSPFALRCESCNLRPASIAVKMPDDETRHLCMVCQKKQENRRQVKSRWVEKFVNFLMKNPVLAKHYNPAALPDTQIEVAQDIGDIAVASSHKGFVGFIYADGNSVGKHMEGQRSIGEYREASTRIFQATENAVYQALAENLQIARINHARQRETEIDIHPFEIITIGGDDVLLLVPGDSALPIAARICQLFGELAAPLTMSAGVVIADEHNPIRFLHELAIQLKSSAKAEYSGHSALDWLVLTSQSTLQTSLDGLRGTPPYQLATEQASQDLWLTERPMSLEKTRVLLRLLKQLRITDFPTSQLHALSASLLDGREESSLFYLYQQARLGRERRVRGEFLENLPHAWGLDANQDPAPWERVLQNNLHVGYRTMLRDLVELYDFVPERSGSELDALWAALLAEET